MKTLMGRFLAATACVLGLAAPLASHGAVVYQFSLAANGDVGPIEIRQTVANFIPIGGLIVTPLAHPSISFASGTPIDPAVSVIGFDQDASETLFGVSLQDPPSTVLFTFDYPDDFFRFTRTFDQEGTFTSTAGLVTSSLPLDTRTPVATLCVSSTGACVSSVPEPGTLALLGLGLAGLAATRRRKQ